MKNLIKKIGQNKFQFFFFVGIVGLLVLALVLSSTIGKNPNNPIDDGNKPNPPDDVVTQPEETVKLPYTENAEFTIVRKFYEKDATKEEQELSLIKFGNSYRTSVGTSYAKKDGSSFEVRSALSGKVVEIKDSPLYGTYVVIEHKDNIKTYYYGLSEVSVAVGSTVKQSDKLGMSGTTEIDQEAGNHVYFKLVKGAKHLNPEKTIGKKISEL